MLNLSRPWSVCALLLCLLAAPLARAQATAPPTALDRQLDRIDLGVTAIGAITGTVSGTNYLNEHIVEDPSSTVGILATIRYTKSPWMGFEGNFSQARYTENFSTHVVGGVQTRANEYSLGYVAHFKDFFGFKPYAAAGGGTTAFHPTRGGGQGLPYQYRATFYYNVGAEHSLFSEHFGLRVHMRQAFFKAPDFLTNYLTINQRTSTLEPGIGFYLKF
jgi:hypothetical protein